MLSAIIKPTILFTTLTTLTPLITAQLPAQLGLGIYSYPHGHQFVAWIPTSTTTQDACKTHSSIQGNNSGRVSNPVCGVPFTVGDYANMTLQCGDEAGYEPVDAESIVVSHAVDEAGETYNNCTRLQSLNTAYVMCDYTGGGLTQYYLCQ